MILLRISPNLEDHLLGGLGTGGIRGRGVGSHLKGLNHKSAVFLEKRFLGQKKITASKNQGQSQKKPEANRLLHDSHLLVSIFPRVY
jgi:hypothetical protein